MRPTATRLVKLGKGELQSKLTLELKEKAVSAGVEPVNSC